MMEDSMESEHLSSKDLIQFKSLIFGEYMHSMDYEVRTGDILNKMALCSKLYLRIHGSLRF
jgi:hypothetical protein